MQKVCNNYFQGKECKEHTDHTSQDKYFEDICVEDGCIICDLMHIENMSDKIKKAIIEKFP